MKLALGVVVVLALVGCREATSGEMDRASETSEVKAPCAGCTIHVPPSRGPVPLIVVLHGDAETSAKWAARWREPALARGWAVLALQCPEALGCNTKWYEWNGDPRWISQQIDEIAKPARIDRARTFLVAWSGGATYASMHATAWQRDFAAIVVHGGGVEPRTRCPSRAMPAYFLVGDRNVYHESAKLFRAYFERCGQEVKWDLLEGANHEAEDAALDAKKANAILDWLSERARTPIVG